MEKQHETGFANRIVKLWLIENFITFFGTGMCDVAVYWTLVNKTNTPLYVSIYLVLKTITSLLVSPFAGVVADRFSRKLTVITTDWFRALVQVIIAALIFLNSGSVVISMLLGSVFVTIGSNLFFPSLSSYIKDILSREQIVAVMGYRAICLQGGTLLGTAAGGAVLAMYSPSVTFLIDGFTFILSGLLFLFFPSDQKLRSGSTASSQKHSMRQDLKQGIRYLKGNRLVRNILLIGLVPAFCVQAINAILSYYCLTYLQVSSTGFGIIEAGFAFGSIAMGFSLKWLRQRFDELKLASLSMFGLAIGLFLVVIFHQFWLAVVAFYMFGMAMMLQNASFQALVTINTDNEFMGRVVSLNYFIMSAIVPIAVVGVSGVVPKVIQVWSLLLGMTILIGLTAFITVSFVQSMRRDQALNRSAKEGM